MMWLQFSLGKQTMVRKEKNKVKSKHACIFEISPSI